MHYRSPENHEHAPGGERAAGDTTRGEELNAADNEGMPDAEAGGVEPDAPISKARQMEFSGFGVEGEGAEDPSNAEEGPAEEENNKKQMLEAREEVEENVAERANLKELRRAFWFVVDHSNWIVFWVLWFPFAVIPAAYLIWRNWLVPAGLLVAVVSLAGFIIVCLGKTRRADCGNPTTFQVTWIVVVVAGTGVLIIGNSFLLAGLYGAVCVVVGAIFVRLEERKLTEEIRRLTEDEDYQKSPQGELLARVDRMGGEEFQDYVADDLLRSRGFQILQKSRGRGDRGGDIIAEKDAVKYAIQCKRQAKKANRHAVLDAMDARKHYRCHVAMVVTNNYFTKDAKEAAEEHGCALVDRDQLEQWITWLSG